MSAVTITPTGLDVAGRALRLVSGEVHPWRLAPQQWPAVLDALVSLGFPAVSAYVPWAVHEVEAGRFDFSGGRDVAAFCTLAAARDLAVVLRVGPDCGAELAGSGWPQRILGDPRCQARRPDGRPYLLVSSTHHCFPPSYASSVVLEEVARWYDAVCAVVAPLQAPAGPVVAVQVDNELGYHFQSNTYALDYHPDAVAKYQAFVRDRWGGLDGVNAAYRTAHRDIAELAPPTDGADGLELHRLDWAAWKEHHVRATLGTLAEMVRARGVDQVPLVHNHHPRTEPPIDLGAVEQSGAADLCGADMYVTRHGGRAVTDLVRHLSGSSKLPWMAELGAGWLALPWLLPMGTTPADAEVSATRALFGGARAANVYMAVERDRWSGSPVSAAGVIRPDRAELWPRLLGVLHELRWDELDRWAPVVLLTNRAEQRRIAARDTLGNAVPCFSQILPLDHRLSRVPDPGTATYERWQTDLANELTGAGVEFDRATTSALPDLGRYELVVLPAVELLEAGAWAALRDAADRGVTVAIGPGRPRLDERLRPLSDAATDSMSWLATPSDLARLLPVAPVRAAHPDVDVVYWSGNGREVVVAWNARAEPITATLELDGSAALRGCWRDEQLVGTGSVTFSLDSFAVQVWELERTSAR